MVSRSWPLPCGQALAPRVAHRPASAQATPQVTVEGPTVRDIQAEVDGLVGGRHAWVVGIGTRSQPGICSGDQHPLSLAATTARSRGRRPACTAWVGSLAGRGRVGDLGSVPPPAAVAGDFWCPCRGRSSQPTGDPPAGVTGRDTAADLFTLVRRERAGRAPSRRLLAPAALHHQRPHRGSALAHPASDQPQRLTLPPAPPALLLLLDRQSPGSHPPPPPPTHPSVQKRCNHP
jgi:hypothetical protein